MSSRRTEAQSALNNARDRQREIEKISEQMEVLLKLFENMNELVQEQEEVVTQIEQKTAAGAADIENGVTQLDTGIEKARSARRKKWWCLLIVGMLMPLQSSPLF
jgi:syntaxin 1B/2/3